MPRIDVSTKAGSYNIEIGSNLLFQTDFRRFNASRYVIITDSTVKNLYGKEVENLLKKQGLKVELLDFPSGERSKTWETAASIGRELARRGYDKDSIIIALGGGVVGDLAGFVASFYMRGINYIQIPTTLIGMIDSSIGGKTGVDIPEGKNLFGTFHQPKAVIIDIDLIEKLPEKEIKNGFAEIIKYGIVKDKKLFEDIEQNFSKRNGEFYSRIIEMSCRIKARIIEQDEKESELRKVLNYGHTVGHAIEASEDYKISHGEAAALGMIFEARISSRLGFLSKINLERQNKLIKALGLPTEYKGNPDDLIEIMKRDKKNRDGKIYFVLPTTIGGIKEENGKVAFPVDESLVRECLKES